MRCKDCGLGGVVRRNERFFANSGEVARGELHADHAGRLDKLNTAFECFGIEHGANFGAFAASGIEDNDEINRRIVMDPQIDPELFATAFPTARIGGEKLYGTYTFEEINDAGESETIEIVGWTGMVDPKWIATYRRYALLVCLVASAILTPSDLFSMTVLAMPLYLLFEFGLLLMKLVYKRPAFPADT